MTKTLSSIIHSLLYRKPLAAPEAPHLRDAIDVKRYIAFVLIALIPIVFFSFTLFGWKVLAVILVSYAFGIGTEAVYAIIFKKPLNEGALVSCLLYALILPPTLPLWMVALGIVFAILFGKAVFGGLGKNIFNPALVGRCFLHLSFPVEMTQRWVPPLQSKLGGLGTWSPSPETITHASPLWELQNNGSMTPLSDLFWGMVPGSIGETSAFLILLGGFFLILTRIASWQIVVSTLLGAAAITGLWQCLGLEAAYFPAIFSGGFLFGAIFMATDPVTAPLTRMSRWVYGFGIGALALFLRNFSNYNEGMMFAILIMNLLAPLLDSVMIQFVYKRRFIRAARAR